MADLDSSSYVPVSFEKALAQLKRDVLLADVHTLIEWLGEFMVLKHNFRVDGNLMREQEAGVMFDVIKKELDKHGCSIEEFGEF